MAGAQFGNKVIQQPAAAHTATVIFLHGLGDSGAGLANIGPAVRLPHVKFVFPTAPTRSITINGGASMPAWFDLYNIGSLLSGKADEESIQQSVNYLGSLVREEMDAGIPPSRIVVGGFSQGGHVAFKYLFSGLTPVAGCIALSTWLEPRQNPLPVSDAAKKMKVFIGHGTADTLIPVPLSTASCQFLRTSGFENVQLKTYPGVPHSTSMQEIDDVRDFLLSLLPDQPLQGPKRPEEVDGMSVRDLKAFLRQRQVDTAGILEKSELIARAKALL